MCQNIRDVKPEIRTYVLKKFLEQIQKLSWINFYHTRKIERADVCDHDEIGLQIYKLQEWLKQQMMDSKKTDLLSQKTLEDSSLSLKDMNDFKIEDEDVANNPAFINDFKEIFWMDPF